METSEQAGDAKQLDGFSREHPDKGWLSGKPTWDRGLFGSSLLNTFCMRDNIEFGCAAAIRPVLHGICEPNEPNRAEH